ncbi:MAG: hypothetical protein BJ554DRAFT_659 [Olpidium bornovanus]|uniref:Uncharacterized protein n=1 Tax=Olpidium bornovanus TaxID=278681 RepID=A0A8H7ZTL0_9FUNG|nr:MAG: hypothetical protein BJ554DRAFT_659 [Olpidium bornovanus]
MAPAPALHRRQPAIDCLPDALPQPQPDVSQAMRTHWNAKILQLLEAPIEAMDTAEPGERKDVTMTRIHETLGLTPDPGTSATEPPSTALPLTALSTAPSMATPSTAPATTAPAPAVTSSEVDALAAASAMPLPADEPMLDLPPRLLCPH